MAMYRYELDEIVPFNECYFIDCFYNALFSMLPHFQADNKGIVTNYLPIYEEDKVFGIQLMWKKFRERKEVLAECGVKEEEISRSDSIVIDIKQQLKMNHPVIVYMDCFYEKNRRDTYMKLHWPHTILIYGYDDLKEEFLIVEHSNREYLDYAKITLSYDEMEICYTSMLRLYGDQGKSTIFTYSSFGSEKRIENKIEDYFEKVDHEYPDLLTGVQLLLTMKEKMQRMACNQREYERNAPSIIELLNHIVNSKIAQLYILQLFHGEEVYVEQMNCIKKLWGKIRYTIVKCFYMNEYDKDVLSNVWNKLDTIIDLETGYLNNIVRRWER